MRSPPVFGSVALLAAAIFSCHPPAYAGGRTASGVLLPSDADQSPVVRYAKLDAKTCQTELNRRNIAWRPVEKVRGVAQPMRISGRLHGVYFHSALKPSQRATSPFEIVDCRLVLAMDDFGEILARHDIVEVIHFSTYRPPPPNLPVDAAATRHGGGLALDAATFVRRDGITLSVENDFHGRIGAPICTSPSGPVPASPQAIELWNIFCEATAARIFNVALSPNFNRPHYNHFHLEVKTGVRWFFIR